MGIIYLYLRIGHLVTAFTYKLADQTIAKGDYHRPCTPARLSPFIADRDQNRPRTKPGRCGKAGTPLMFRIFPGLSRFHALAFFLCFGGTDPARKRRTRLRRLAARFLERASTAMNSFRLARRSLYGLHSGWFRFALRCFSCRSAIYPGYESRLLVAIECWRPFWPRCLAGAGCGGYRLILEVSEHAGAVQGHGHGMFEMGAGPAILGLDGPAVVQSTDLLGSHGDHGFDRQHEAGLEPDVVF